MLRMLIDEFKPFCQLYEKMFPKLYLNDDAWNAIEEIVISLKPCA